MNLREMKQHYYDAIWAYVAEGGIEPYIVSEDSTPAAKAALATSEKKALSSEVIAFVSMHKLYYTCTQNVKGFYVS